MTAKEIEASLEKLQASFSASLLRIFALEKENVEIRAKSGKLEADLAGLMASVAGIETVKTADVDAKIAAVEGRIISGIKSASENALLIAAAAGVPAVSDKLQSEDTSPTAIKAKFKSISDANERAAFYEKHKKVLLA